MMLIGFKSSPWGKGRREREKEGGRKRGQTKPGKMWKICLEAGQERNFVFLHLEYSCCVELLNQRDTEQLRKRL